MLNLNVNPIYKWVAVVVVICLVGAGCFFGGRCSVKPEIKIVTKTEIKWKDKVVYREYEKYTCSDLAAELLKYDTSEPRLDGVMQGNVFRATAGLNQRDWSRDFTLKAGAGDSAKWYAIASILSFVCGAVVGGAVDYKAQQSFGR